MLNKIDPKEVTVLINGPYNKYTKKTVKSVKKHLPGAKIIISCWEGNQVDENNVDEVIYNQDPGGFVIKGYFIDFGFNYNRILVAIKNGLTKVKTKYCLRLRNDLKLTNDNILIDYESYFPLKKEEFAYFKRRMVSSQLFSVKWDIIPKYSELYLTVSDWFNFGLTEDLKNYWNEIPLIEDQESYAYYYKKESNNKFFVPIKSYPEQYFTTEFFKKKAQVWDIDRFYINEASRKKSNELIMNNFIFVGKTNSGIYCLKKRYSFISRFPNIFWFAWNYIDTLFYYQENFDKDMIITKDKYWLKTKYLEKTHEKSKGIDMISNYKKSKWKLYRLYTKSTLFMIFIKPLYKIKVLFKKNILGIKQNKKGKND